MLVAPVIELNHLYGMEGQGAAAPFAAAGTGRLLGRFARARVTNTYVSLHNLLATTW